jgi:hypothetical protein
MKFASKSPGGSNGQAAWAAVYGLMKVLRAKDLLSDDDIRQAISEAQRVAPSEPNARDIEAKEMLTDLGKSI